MDILQVKKVMSFNNLPQKLQIINLQYNQDLSPDLQGLSPELSELPHNWAIFDKQLNE